MSAEQSREDAEENDLFDRLMEAAIDEDKEKYKALVDGASRQALIDAITSHFNTELAEYDRDELYELLVDAYVNGSKALSDYTDDELRTELMEMDRFD